MWPSPRAPTAGPTSANGYITTTCTDNNPPEVGVACCPQAGHAGQLPHEDDLSRCRPRSAVQICVPVTASDANRLAPTTCPVIASGRSAHRPASRPLPRGSTRGRRPPARAVHHGPVAGRELHHRAARSLNSWTVRPARPRFRADGGQLCSPSGPTPSNAYTTTTCTPLDGKQLATTTTSRVQVYNVSGGVQASAGTDNTTTTGPTIVGRLLRARTRTRRCRPTAPPTWTPADAAAYPSCCAGPARCDANTRDPRSVNSLADVAQYYYITDLRTRRERAARPELLPRRRAGRRLRRRGRPRPLAAHDDLRRSRWASRARCNTAPTTSTAADRRLRRHPHRRPELAAVAGPDAGLLREPSRTTTTRARSTTSGTRR